MSLTANSYIKLDVHSPKKDFVTAVGVPTTAATEVCIRLGTNIPIQLRESVVGQIQSLKDYVRSVLKDGPTSLQIPYNGSESEIEIDGTHTVDDISIVLGATVRDNQQSHFITRTLDRLIEVFLEQTKAQ